MKHRKDIQALRALAVALVVLFHLDPRFAPGGFAGVDVFFVISGFLITGSLTTELAKSGRVALANFWARRARRLLPVALLVIAVTVLVSLVLVPPFSRSDSLWDAIASTFYFENWHLGFVSADYFAAPNPSPFQHYWSLAVEEQFYLIWPVLILLVGRFKNGRLLPWFVGVLTAVSFAFSVASSYGQDQFSYFNTFGRAWEFGVGALVALSVGKLMPKAFGMAAVGLLAATVFAISETDVFPGFLALIPVFGAALFIACQKPVWLERLYGARAIQFIGDQSYGIYLWHWPITLLLPLALPSLGKSLLYPLILGLTVALAVLSKRFVEDPIRTQRFAALKSGSKSLLLAGAASLAAMAVILGASTFTSQQIAAAQEQVSSIEGKACFGPASLAEPKCASKDIPLAQTYDQATHDSADPNAACMTPKFSSALIHCVTPAQGTPAKRALLIGDSHAAMYLGPLKEIAKARNWELTLVYKASCAFNTAERNTTVRGVTCSEWNQNVQAWLASQPKFDFAFTSYMTSNISTDLAEPGYSKSFEDGFESAWRVLSNAGSKVIVFRDGPKMSKEMASCFGDSKTAATCQMPTALALTPDLAFKNAPYRLDLTDLICSDVCKSVQGGLFVYRDTHHLSLAYAKALTPYLVQRFDQLVGAGE